MTRYWYGWTLGVLGVLLLTMLLLAFVVPQ